MNETTGLKKNPEAFHSSGSRTKTVSESVVNIGYFYADVKEKQEQTPFRLLFADQSP